MGRKVLERFKPTYLRVLSMIEDGRSLNDIAKILNGEGVPTSRGTGRWHASTIRAIRDSRTAETIGGASTTGSEQP